MRRTCAVQTIRQTEPSRLDIDGDLNAFFAIGAPASGSFIVTADEFTQLGRVQLDSGDITLIDVAGDIAQPSASGVSSIAVGTIAPGNLIELRVGGSLRGDVIARPGTSSDLVGGRIGQIIVGDHIGRTYSASAYGDPESSTGFPALTPGSLNGIVLCIEATNGIDRIEADTMTCLIEADRVVNSSDADGYLEQLVTRTGSFKGLVQAQGLQDNDSSTGPAAVDIAGDFRGRMKLDYDPSAGAFYGLFKVRGSLLPLTLNSVTLNGFECRATELRGQIIVNGNDSSESWTSAVKVGSTTISHTGGVYSTPSASLGGGAVGLAPFKFYPTDCVPEHDDLANGPLYSDFLDEEAVPVILRWFGPVKLPEGYALSTLLKVECRNPHEGGECEWIDQTVVFSLVLHPFGDNRAIGLAGPGVPKDGIYRVRYAEPSEAKLLCDQVEGNPVAGNFPSDECSTSGGAYYFRIDADCNNNGIPDSVDIANNGSLDVDPQNGIIDSCQVDTCPCDWDGSRYVAVPDIFAFLADWFAEDPDARCFGATGDPPAPCGVSAIFAFLSCWFAANPMDPC